MYNNTLLLFVMQHDARGPPPMNEGVFHDDVGTQTKLKNLDDVGTQTKLKNLGTS